METTNGGDLMIFLRGETIAFSTSHKLSINAATTEVSSKDHGAWTNKTALKISWSISSENLFIEKGDHSKNQLGFGDLYDAMIFRNPVYVAFTNATNIPADGSGIPDSGWMARDTNKYGGAVIITSLELNAPNGETATYSITMEGAGKLEHLKSKPVQPTSTEQPASK